MDYLNRANSVLTNTNSMYNNASNMMGNIRQPPPGYPMQNQVYPPNHGIKETFYDSMQPSEWWIVLVLLIILFIMLYWMYSKKQNENLLL